ncbi:MAG: alpha/beta fold hydrolase [Bryobacterales bacterium]|nr:alpha/beta fold hydrolase [Bryobacterales bacterium]MBV9397417.1 alpha/beta fold hydrolase [Bryobacterales bacterium]
MRVVYLHGFASSPKSGKAQFFARRFAEHGIATEIPELDQGDFGSLTITGQLRIIEKTVGKKPAVLMGSSLGGYLAALFASTHPVIETLILMAPALRFPKRWKERYPAEEMARWKRDGVYPIFHYGYGRQMPLSYGFVEDSQRYLDEPEFTQPALILHGVNDQVVPVEVSQDVASTHANITLRLFDSGHELTDVLESMWSEVCAFLGLGRFQTS